MTSLLLTPDATTPPAVWPPTEGLALPTTYELDSFQKHAVTGIHAGHHVFVTAKTGSGKTFVGEYLIARALAAGKRVFYTTPIKSLSNQKYHDLKVLFPAARIGILTGDIKMCPDADVVVMTAEILRNLFYKRGTATEGVGVSVTVSLEGVVGIVMDEVHYIQDPDRGHVWEETMILCPRDLQLVLLSATMPSAASLAKWLAELHGRPTVLVGTTHRVVPLVSGVLRSGSGSGSAGGGSVGGGSAVGWHLEPYHDTRTGWAPDGYRAWLADRKAAEDSLLAHRRAVAGRTAGDASVKRAAGAHTDNPMGRLRRTVGWLRDTAALPALCFVFSRKECERLAAAMEGDFLEEGSDAAGAARMFDFHLSRYRATLEKSPQYHQVRALAIRGIGFHHSGLQPLLKEIVELLFARGFIRLLFATETFAVGLNMPTKTVVFLELSKVSGDGSGDRRLLRSDEYLQMAGRAGRRGKDTQGLVIYEPMRDPVDLGELKGMVCGALPPLESRMRFHYDFLLKRALTGSLGVAEESYWAAQQRTAREALRADLVAATATAEAATAAISAEEAALLDEYARLTQAVAASKNAAQRRAKMALERWVEENCSGRQGARWEHIKAKGERRAAAVTERNTLAAQVTRWDGAPLVETTGLEICLQRWGFLAGGGGLTSLGMLGSDSTLASVDTPSLTLLGQLGSDIAEGHNILMPLLAISGKAATLKPEELPCILAAFIREGSVPGEGPPLSMADLGDEAIRVLDWLDAQARACQAEEDRVRVLSPVNFWDLSSLWVCVTSRYIAGVGLPEIAAEFNLFEGNVQRGLLKVANLLEEWAVLCELRRDLEGLERVRGFRLLREDVVVDSLYLRL